ncbi:MAG: DUF6600 domain-containing protein [Vicinamibacterales bacterium]
MRYWLSSALALFLLSAAAPAGAQDAQAPLEPAGLAITLTFVDGRVEIARATGLTPAQAPDLLDDGDRLRTLDGRAELVLTDGAIAHVETGTDLTIDGDRVRLVRGRLIVRTGSAAPLEIDTPVGLARLEAHGEYDLTARDLDGDTSVAAVRGRATLSLASTDLPIAADDQVAVDPRGLEPQWTRWADRRDTFTAWAERRIADMEAARQDQPLPPELAAYAPGFATYGRWDTVAPYGPVWFPTAAPGWRPYADGWWRYTRFGWTWIDRDPWGWPVHHFGRWGRHASRGWYWIPRRTWGPAWVGWAVDANYVGWAPLGWQSQPVVDFFVGSRLGPLDLWAGTWSVVPRTAFGVRGSLGRFYADPRRLPRPVLGGFVVQQRGPRGPDGWTRRLSPAPSYGRPSPARRDRRYAPTPQPRPRGGGAAVPRGSSRDDAVVVTTPRERVRPAPGVRGRDDTIDRRLPPASPGPGAPAVRARDPQMRTDGVDRDRSRPVAGDGPARGAYGRPAPSPGSAWGRPEAAPRNGRPPSTGGARGSAPPPARGASRGSSERSRGSSAGGSRDGAGGGAGGRRRPR